MDDHLESDILELFEDDPGAERSHRDSRSKSHKRRHHGRYSGSQQRSQRDNYSGSDDYSNKSPAHSDNEPVDEWGDDLMGDQKDRKYLASLTEIERERILTERQERRDVLNEQRELQLKLNAGAQMSTRQTRSRHTTRDTLSGLKQAREHWSSSLSDEDEEKPQATLDEINSICLPRNQLEQWLFRPFFETTVKGCFVRIMTRTKDRNQYKMMEILQVGQSRPPYHLNKTLTDKYLLLRFGTAEKEYSMETISNSAIKPEEYNSWKSALHSVSITMDHVQKKLQDLEKAQNYQLSDAEITSMINERNRLRRMETGSNTALERSQLLQLHTAARQNGDWEELKKIEAQLEALDKPIKTSLQLSHKSLLAPSSSRSAIADGKSGARRKPNAPSLSTSRTGDTNASVSKFPLVPDLRVPELSLRSKVSPGFMQVMAENGGYDMSFVNL
ncbi:RNA polymerase-associated protein rtf1 [Coemansia brasiliensis]|uniref:RNA polymerase-associated protein rtf1 n=1 Tax=Coemansia brasiliensis TaxID=2650707 RepID=A0A9W8I5S3_9FUNG|nr:RNA polymerase-associated protein rtf1 [Coemansia brasiliensis]